MSTASACGARGDSGWRRIKVKTIKEEEEEEEDGVMEEYGIKLKMTRWREQEQIGRAHV